MYTTHIRPMRNQIKQFVLIFWSVLTEAVWHLVPLFRSPAKGLESEKFFLNKKIQTLWSVVRKKRKVNKHQFSSKRAPSQFMIVKYLNTWTDNTWNCYSIDEDTHWKFLTTPYLTTTRAQKNEGEMYPVKNSFRCDDL